MLIKSNGLVFEHRFEFLQGLFNLPGHSQGIRAVLPDHHHDYARFTPNLRRADGRFAGITDGGDFAQRDVVPLVALDDDFCKLFRRSGLAGHL